MLLTRQQFNEIKNESWPLIDAQEHKKCLILARDLESKIPDLETSDPELHAAAQKLITQLKWAGFLSIRDEEEFCDLFRDKLLEGLELGYATGSGLNEMVAKKLTWQFGFKLPETLQSILQATRENLQQIGANPIMVKNETKPARPVIRNWLIDFLRNTSSDPNETDEINYLFKNSNVKKLPEKDRKALGQVLAFHNTFKFLAQQVAQRQREELLAVPLEERTSTKETTAPEYQSSQQKPENQLPNSQGQNQITPPPAYVPPKPSPAYSDKYHEPVEENDLAGLRQKQTPKPPNLPVQGRPSQNGLVQGNVVNLKDMEK